jgi:hypothetical protein
MKKTRGRASAEVMRDAMQVGDALVRSGYCSVETMGQTLKLIRNGKFDAADAYLASVVRLRQAQRKRSTE